MGGNAVLKENVIHVAGANYSRKRQIISINNFRILRKLSHFWFIKWMSLGMVPNDELVIENTIADLNKAKLVLLKYW